MMPSKNGILTFQFFWGCFSWFSCRLEKVCQFFPLMRWTLFFHHFVAVVVVHKSLKDGDLSHLCCREKYFFRSVLLLTQPPFWQNWILKNLVQTLRTEQLFSTVFFNLNMIFSIYFSTAWCHSFNWLPKPSYTKYVAFGSNKMIELER